MERIVYVTGNYGKYVSVKEKFESKKIDIVFYEYDFNEPDVNDIEVVSIVKALEAYNILQKPCFVADSGFYINNYPNNPGYPGAFVKRSKVSSDVDKLLKDMEEVEDRSCYFLDCLTFYDGCNFYTFFGESKGYLTFEKRGNNKAKAKSNLWLVFMPENQNKTLAEMTEEEMMIHKNNTISATNQFADWYKSFYVGKSKVLG